VARKSTTADSTARVWFVIADARSVYMFVLTGDTAAIYCAWGFGEIYSVKSTADTFNCFICGRTLENSGVQSNDAFDKLSTLTGSVSGLFMVRTYAGTGTSITVGRHGDGVKGSTSALLGTMQYPNPEDSNLYLSNVFVTENGGNVRGWQRGFYMFCHAISNVNDGDTFNGVGQFAGRSFLLLKTSGNNGIYCIETSATLDTN
jgi:hypothetical protein